MEKVLCRQCDAEISHGGVVQENGSVFCPQCDELLNQGAVLSLARTAAPIASVSQDRRLRWFLRWPALASASLVVILFLALCLALGGSLSATRELESRLAGIQNDLTMAHCSTQDLKAQLDDQTATLRKANLKSEDLARELASAERRAAATRQETDTLLAAKVAAQETLMKHLTSAEDNLIKTTNSFYDEQSRANQAQLQAETFNKMWTDAVAAGKAREIQLLGIVQQLSAEKARSEQEAAQARQAAAQADFDRRIAAMRARTAEIQAAAQEQTARYQASVLEQRTREQQWETDRLAREADEQQRKIEALEKASKQEAEACSWCNGTGNGRTVCMFCKGWGSIRGFTCQSCKGRKFTTCQVCGGTGHKK